MKVLKTWNVDCLKFPPINLSDAVPIHEIQCIHPGEMLSEGGRLCVLRSLLPVLQFYGSPIQSVWRTRKPWEAMSRSSSALSPPRWRRTSPSSHGRKTLFHSSQVGSAPPGERVRLTFSQGVSHIESGLFLCVHHGWERVLKMDAISWVTAASTFHLGLCGSNQIFFNDWLNGSKLVTHTICYSWCFIFIRKLCFYLCSWK